MTGVGKSFPANLGPTFAGLRLAKPSRLASAHRRTDMSQTSLVSTGAKKRTVPFSLIFLLMRKWGQSLVLVAVLCNQAFAAEGRFLWKIGEADRNTAEFALGPKDFANYSQDANFVVGVSTAKRDWPYVQPGPADAWAGAKKHSFVIYFGLKQKPKGTCTLHIVLADSQSQSPPALRLDVNGKKLSDLQTPPGGGDASIQGEPSKGRECRFDILRADLQRRRDRLRVGDLNRRLSGLADVANAEPNQAA